MYVHIYIYILYTYTYILIYMHIYLYTYISVYISISLFHLGVVARQEVIQGRQLDRQLRLGHWVRLRVVDLEGGALARVALGGHREVDRDWLAPVALAREYPVAEFVRNLRSKWLVYICIRTHTLSHTHTHTLTQTHAHTPVCVYTYI